MKKVVLYLIILVSLLVSCADTDHKTLSINDNRTVIFYMIGDNSLSRFVEVNLSELQKGLKGKELNNGHLVLYIDDKGSKPKIIELTVNKGVVSKEVVKTYEEQNSADPDVMRNVIRDIKNKFSATNYGLVLWSHASAWLPKDANKLISTRTFGDDYGSEMDIHVLADALDAFHFDFILFDACYMASIEVVYELRNVADYIIASPMEVMAKGFPYELIADKFFKMPNADLIGISTDFFNYYNSQKGDYRTASVVLADMSKIDNIAKEMQSLMSTYKTQLHTVNLEEVQVTEHLFFNQDKNVLYDFEDYIKHLTSNSNSVKDYIGVKNAIDDAIIYRAHTPSSYFAQPERSYEIENCSGFSIYPLGFHPELDRWYEKLGWYQAVYQ